MSATTYVVIRPRAWMDEGDFGFYYLCDLRQFATRKEAIRHGFTFDGSDDFNVGVLKDGRLVKTLYMDKDVDVDPDKVAVIARSAGLR